MSAAILRNLFISSGAYYLSWWLAYPLAFVYGKATGSITYHGDFSAAVVMPLVTGLPFSLVAAMVGASVALLVESRRRLQWAAFPAALYAYYGYVGHHWLDDPTLSNQVGQVIGALFLAISCMLGAAFALKYRSPSPVGFTS
jgi:hypothetical protein